MDRDTFSHLVTCSSLLRNDREKTQNETLYPNSTKHIMKCVGQTAQNTMWNVRSICNWAHVLWTKHKTLQLYKETDLEFLSNWRCFVCCWIHAKSFFCVFSPATVEMTKRTTSWLDTTLPMWCICRIHQLWKCSLRKNIHHYQEAL